MLCFFQQFTGINLINMFGSQLSSADTKTVDPIIFGGLSLFSAVICFFFVDCKYSLSHVRNRCWKKKINVCGNYNHYFMSDCYPITFLAKQRQTIIRFKSFAINLDICYILDDFYLGFQFFFRAKFV